MNHRGARVLVADDDLALVAFLTTLLEREGYTVQAAGNGQEALDLATESPSDLILLDLRMPVMDGWTCCRLLKQRSETVNIPVVVMSADGASEAATADLRCEHFLHKPFDVDDLLSCVRDHITKHG